MHAGWNAEKGDQADAVLGHSKNEFRTSCDKFVIDRRDRSNAPQLTRWARVKETVMC